MQWYQTICNYVDKNFISHNKLLVKIHERTILYTYICRSSQSCVAMLLLVVNAAHRWDDKSDNSWIVRFFVWKCCLKVTRWLLSTIKSSPSYHVRTRAQTILHFSIFHLYKQLYASLVFWHFYLTSPVCLN